jgi:hypothetical protein
VTKAPTTVHWSYRISDRDQTLTIERHEWYVRSDRAKPVQHQTFTLDEVRENLWKAAP